jgi:hypothetical protein
MTSLRPSSGADIAVRMQPGDHVVVSERELDALIRAGWRVLETDFDETAFLRWRTRAYECLEALVGPHHVYTEHFRINMSEPELITILSGVGILGAATIGREWQLL